MKKRISNIKNFVDFTADRPYGEIAISTPHGTNRVKKYNGKDIFLDTGTEFVIELDNPTRLKYLVKIKINGEYISNAGLVLKPGEHSYLERYIDTDRKFLFETYDVSADRKELIEKNGLVEIEFYKESFPVQWDYDYCFPIYTPPPIYYPPPPPPYPWITYTSNNYINDDSINNNNFICYSAQISSGQKQIETGRVEQGSQSEQSFQNTYGSFESFYSHRDEYKLYPVSQREAVIHQEIRSYCSGCGRRKRSGENFCPKCGQKY